MYEQEARVAGVTISEYEAEQKRAYAEQHRNARVPEGASLSSLMALTDQLEAGVRDVANAFFAFERGFDPAEAMGDRSEPDAGDRLSIAADRITRSTHQLRTLAERIRSRA